jgi:hypothetical protein
MLTLFLEMIFLPTVNYYNIKKQNINIVPLIYYSSCEKDTQDLISVLETMK